MRAFAARLCSRPSAFQIWLVHNMITIFSILYSTIFIFNNFNRQDVTPLTFTKVCDTCKSDLSIAFAKYHHDNESFDDAFDGVGMRSFHFKIQPKFN